MTNVGAVGLTIFLSVALSQIWRIWSRRHGAGTRPLSRISPNKVAPSVVLLFAGLLIARSAIGVAEEGPKWFVFIAAALVLTAIFLPPLFSGDVLIRDSQVVGPGATFGPFMSITRTAIPISDITAVKNGSFGYSYVEARDGRHVYFSPSYSGYPRFLSTLENEMRSVRHEQSGGEGSLS